MVINASQSIDGLTDLHWITLNWYLKGHGGGQRHLDEGYLVGQLAKFMQRLGVKKEDSPKVRRFFTSTLPDKTGPFSTLEMPHFQTKTQV